MTSSVVIDGTQLRVSRWSFGTASLHHIFSAKQRRRLLDGAADAGFSHFDTSPYYGHGLAECDLGRFLHKRREHLTVATKVGLYPSCASSTSAWNLWIRKGVGRMRRVAVRPRVDWSLSTAIESLDASLARLRTDYVDILFLHEPDPQQIAAEEFHCWLESEVKRGRVRAWGLAGPGVPALAWVRDDHPLARVLQVKDSLEHREADPLLAKGRSLQFTYGYLSAVRDTAGVTNMGGTRLMQMLDRNPKGSIVVSTRQVARLSEFAEAAHAQ